MPRVEITILSKRSWAHRTLPKIIAVGGCAFGYSLPSKSSIFRKMRKNVVPNSIIKDGPDITGSLPHGHVIA